MQVDDEFVKQYKNLVYWVAWKFKSIEQEEAVSLCWLALIKSAITFDETKGARFLTYAILRMYGILKDELRRRGRVDRYGNERPTTYSLEMLWGDGTPYDIRDDSFSFPEFGDDFEYMIRYLMPREQQILRLMYVDEHNTRLIAEGLGVSQSRVCQIHRRAIKKLRLQRAAA